MTDAIEEWKKLHPADSALMEEIARRAGETSKLAIELVLLKKDLAKEHSKHLATKKKLDDLQTKYNELKEEHSELSIDKIFSNSDRKLLENLIKENTELEKENARLDKAHDHLSDEYDELRIKHYGPHDYT
jgi:DNA repair exonuclease SbcCD ATPase subunit